MRAPAVAVDASAARRSNAVERLAAMRAAIGRALARPRAAHDRSVPPHRPDRTVHAQSPLRLESIASLRALGSPTTSIIRVPHGSVPVPGCAVEPAVRPDSNCDRRPVPT